MKKAAAQTLRCLSVSSLVLLTAAGSHAASIGGVVFEDRDRDGVFGVDDAPLRRARVQLLGLDGTVFERGRTANDGSWLFENLADGDYVVSVSRNGYRPSLPDPRAVAAPIPDFPFGSARYSSFGTLVSTLRTVGSFAHIGLGDSIGFGFNFCGSLFGEDGYFEPTSARLADAAAPVLIADKQSVPGHETHDLLTPGGSSDFPFTDNDVFYAIDNAADMVSISIGGNDFLGAEDGGDPAVAAALVTARRNIQEILSSLETELPGAALEINTVYDNEEGEDALHNVWVPIWNQVLRETAWAQDRPVRIAAIYPEYAHDADGVPLGEPGLICNDFFGFDGIHPTNSGYDVHEEKLWQAIGGVTLSGGADRLDVDMGLQRPLRTLPPLEFEEVAGDTLNPEDALATDDQGALVPADNAEFRVRVFLGNPPGNQELQHALVKIRYRTTGAPIDDFYRFEASLDNTFSPPGSTPADWNTIVPIVGSSGDAGAEILAFPDQPGFRTVAAPLFKGAPTSNAGTLDWSDLQTLSVRLVTTAVGSPDAFSVEWDSAWVEAFSTTPAAAARNERPAADSSTSTTISAPVALRVPTRVGTATLLEDLGRVPRPGGLDELARRPEALPGLLLALRTGDEIGRPRAAELLGRVPSLAPSDQAWVVQALRTALADGSTPVRAAAIRALAARGDGASAGAIAELRGDAGLGLHVARALGELDRPSSLDALLDIARSAEATPATRHWAARGLAGSAHAQAAERLLPLLESEDVRIRRLALAGLARFGEPTE